MAEYLVQDTTMKAIADAIRSKGNTSASLTPAGMASAIGNISTGVETGDATATAADILSGKTAYVDGEKITGTIVSRTSNNLSASGATVTVPAGHYASQATKSVSTATQATPSISVGSDGKITASATQTAGYVAAGTKSSTKQLTTQAAKTVTPSTSEQTAVASGRYTTGAVKVAGDANLVAENIKNGVSIFGVSGSYAGRKVVSGTFTSPTGTQANLSGYPFEITGLGGQPSVVACYYIGDGSKHSNSSTQYNITNIVYINDKTTYSYGVNSSTYGTGANPKTPLMHITPTSNGFEISATFGYSDYRMFTGILYGYIAII